MVRPEICQQLGIELRIPAGATVALQRALESGPAVLGCVHAHFLFGQPFARSDLGRRRHHLRYGFAHSLIQIHDVVGRHFRQSLAVRGHFNGWFVSNQRS